MTAPETLPPELAELGELLREAPPRPDPAWARALDARAAAGFARPPRRTLRSRLPRLRVLAPALAVVALLVVAAGTVLRSTPAADDSGTIAASPEGIQRGEGAAGSSSPAPAPAPSAARSASGGSSPARSAPAPTGPPVTRRARLEERSAQLTLGAPARDIERVADDVVHVTDAAGGYVAESSVSGGRGAGAALELRIPAARLQRTLADLSRLGHVRRRSQATLDITTQGVSARSRLSEARKERLGLLRALARATTVNETASVKARLRTVDRRIGRAAAALRRVTARANYATVDVSVVAERAQAAAPATGGGWTPGDALHDALRVLEVTAGVLLVALAVALPVAIAALLAWLAARALRHRRIRRALDAV